MPAALSAIALLAACNSGTANNSSAANVAAPANTAAAAPAPAAPASAPGAAPAATGPVDQAFIQGHWAPSPACGETITFEADGTARVSDDPRPGRWALSGETLTVTPPDGQAQPTQVARAGDNLVATQNGRTMTMTRCDAPATQATKG